MRDVEDKDLALHGLKKKEEILRPIMQVRVCPKCQHENAPVAVFCSKCGATLQTAPTDKRIEALEFEMEQMSEALKSLGEWSVALEREAPQAAKALRKKMTSKKWWPGGGEEDSRDLRPQPQSRKAKPTATKRQ
jgi:ribosomal protein L40E